MVEGGKGSIEVSGFYFLTRAMRVGILGHCAASQKGAKQAYQNESHDHVLLVFDDPAYL
jgi:hypothetical protein